MTHDEIKMMEQVLKSIELLGTLTRVLGDRITALEEKTRSIEARGQR